MSTFYPRPGDVQEKWFVVDAKGEVVGRLASRVAAVLRGKTDPKFHPAVDPKTHVIVVNADKAVLTGKKAKQKLYQRHSGYPGGFKQRTAEDLRREKPTEIMRHAIRGMLPKTRLGDDLMTHVIIYAAPEHPHKAQKPTLIQLTKRSRTA